MQSRTPRGPNLPRKLGNRPLSGNQLRLFLGIQMVKIGKELIKAMGSPQVFVTISQLVLAELRGGIACPPSL
jgi:hypothetical protein